MQRSSSSSAPTLSDEHIAALGFIPREHRQNLTKTLRLSPREDAIVELALSDVSEEVIASNLGISKDTVHTYLGRIYRKLNIHSRCQLALRLFRTYVTITDPSSQRRGRPPFE